MTLVGRLRVPNSIPDHQLLQDPNWPLDEKQKRCQCCTELLMYGKHNYWDGDKIIDQIVNLATQVFPYVFSDCQAFFVFNNAANHAYFAKDVFLAIKMNLKVGGKQPQIRNDFNDAKQEIQPIVFPKDNHDILLLSKLKRLKQVLTERGLWRNKAPDGKAFLLECPICHHRPSCNLYLNGDYCPQAIISKQLDF